MEFRINAACPCFNNLAIISRRNVCHGDNYRRLCTRIPSFTHSVSQFERLDVEFLKFPNTTWIYGKNCETRIYINRQGCNVRMQDAEFIHTIFSKTELKIKINYSIFLFLLFHEGSLHDGYFYTLIGQTLLWVHTDEDRTRWSHTWTYTIYTIFSRTKLNSK